MDHDQFEQSHPEDISDDDGNEPLNTPIRGTDRSRPNDAPASADSGVAISGLRDRRHRLLQKTLNSPAALSPAGPSSAKQGSRAGSKTERGRVNSDYTDDDEPEANGEIVSDDSLDNGVTNESSRYVEVVGGGR